MNALSKIQNSENTLKAGKFSHKASTPHVK